MPKATVNSFLNFFIVLVFVFFIYSGLIKWLNIIPIDATIFFAIPLVLAMSVKVLFLRNSVYKINAIIIVAFIALMIWIAITCLYTISEEFYKDKLLRTALISLAFFFPLIFFTNFSYIKYFINSMTILGVAVIIILAIVYAATGSLDIIFFTTDIEDLNIPDYLVISETLGIFIFINHSRNNVIILPLKIMAFIFMIMIGGKGPVILFILIYTLYYLFRTKFTLKKVLVFLIVSLLFVNSLSFFQENKISRLLYSRVTSFSEDKSRQNLFYTSLSILKDKFVFGTGYGGFGMAAENKDERLYPHNIILEIFVETGIIGLVLILLVLGYLFFRIFWRIYCKKKDIATIDLALCYTYIFLEAMKSSSFVDIRNMFAIIGVILSYYAIEHNQRILQNKSS